jgi:hypothetical protein
MPRAAEKSFYTNFTDWRGFILKNVPTFLATPGCFPSRLQRILIAKRLQAAGN